MGEILSFWPKNDDEMWSRKNIQNSNFKIRQIPNRRM